jgi:hypothetical protein
MSSETDHTIEGRSIHDAGDIPASDVLYQDAPEQRPGLRLEDMEAKLKTTNSPILKKFLETQIKRLKAENRIRGECGIERPKVAAKFDPAEKAKFPQLPHKKPRRWVPPNRPLTIEDIRIRRAMNAAADAAEAAKVSSQDIAMTAVEVEDVPTATPEGIDKEAQINSANNEKDIACPQSTQSDKSDGERTATKMKWVLAIGFLVWVLWQVANGVFMWGIRLHWWGHTPGMWKY